MVSFKACALELDGLLTRSSSCHQGFTKLEDVFNRYGQAVDDLKEHAKVSQYVWGILFFSQNLFSVCKFVNWADLVKTYVLVMEKTRDKALYYLLIFLQKLRAMPVISLRTPTLCLVGAPNVGKSSLVRILSSGKPEVCFEIQFRLLPEIYIPGWKSI